MNTSNENTKSQRRKLNIKVLIPAAGYGTRVGSPPAKELMIRPDTKKPMIQYALDMARKFGLVSTVISRNNKIELNDYIYSLDDFDNNKIEICGIESSQDWQESLLKSKAYWGDFNIVVLPDTSWESELAVGLIKEKAIDGSDLVIATHQVKPEDQNQWGVVCKDSNSTVYWCEKPSEIPQNLNVVGAWGIFGFHKKVGIKLLEQILESQKNKQFFKANITDENQNISTTFLELTSFKDWTR